MLHIPRRIRDILEAMEQKRSPERGAILRREQPSPGVTRLTYRGQPVCCPPFGDTQDEARLQYFWAARQANLTWQEDVKEVDQVGFALAVLDKVLE